MRIAENIERIVELIDKKVREEIFFSDKAMDEITFLFQRLIEILNTTAEIILARNTILSKYVEESERGVIRGAIETTASLFLTFRVRKYSLPVL